MSLRDRIPPDYVEQLHNGHAMPVGGQPCKACAGRGWSLGVRGGRWACPVCDGRGWHPPISQSLLTSSATGTGRGS
jgi:hypothetical protein